jgi:hypothetical protein
MLTTQVGYSRFGKPRSQFFGDLPQCLRGGFVLSASATTQQRWTTGPRWTARFSDLVVHSKSFSGNGLGGAGPRTIYSARFCALRNARSSGPVELKPFHANGLEWTTNTKNGAVHRGPRGPCHYGGESPVKATLLGSNGKKQAIVVARFG